MELHIPAADRQVFKSRNTDYIFQTYDIPSVAAKDLLMLVDFTNGWKTEFPVCRKFSDPETHICPKSGGRIRNLGGGGSKEERKA